MSEIKTFEEYIEITKSLFDKGNKPSHSYIDYMYKNLDKLKEINSLNIISFNDKLLHLLSQPNALKLAYDQKLYTIVDYLNLNTRNFDKTMTQDIIYNVNSFLDRKMFDFNRSVKSENLQFKHLNINRKYSLMYYQDKKFRDKVLKTVNDDTSKISLDLDVEKIYDEDKTGENQLYGTGKIPIMDKMTGTLIPINDGIFMNNGMRIPTLLEMQNDGNSNFFINFFNNVVPNFTPCYGIKNLSVLQGIHTLDLSHNSDITDVSMLSGVYDLNLTNCQNITNVHMLNKVHTLKLKNIKSITDVSFLGDVHTLDLSSCLNFTDVSALFKVHTLNLSDCEQITDVSCLGGLHTLILSYCTISDVSALGKVHNLNLSICEQITDISALSNVHTLDLSENPHITNENLHLLKDVNTLNLSECQNFDDLSPLINVENLFLSSCQQIEDVSMLSGVKHLDISFCPNISNISRLCKVHTLNLSGNKQITDVSMLTNVHTLYLLGCDGVKDVYELNNVDEIYFLNYKITNTKSDSSLDVDMDGNKINFKLLGNKYIYKTENISDWVFSH